MYAALGWYSESSIRSKETAEFQENSRQYFVEFCTPAQGLGYSSLNKRPSVNDGAWSLVERDCVIHTANVLKGSLRQRGWFGQRRKG